MGDINFKMLKPKTLNIGFLETHTKLENRHLTKILRVSKNIKLNSYTSDNIAENAEKIDLFLSFRFPDDFLKNARNLKWMHALSAGVNTVIPKIKNTGILLTNSSGVHPINIAEHVFGMLLMHARKLNQALLFQKKREWKHFKNEEMHELYGKTMIIIGYGAIGERIGKIGKSFGLNIIGVKRTITRNKAKARYADRIISSKELSEYLPLADYVVIALPSTPSTIKFFDKEYLSIMKENSVLVNIGRGDVINEVELIKALKLKKIFAMLDVFEHEPLPKGSELWSLDNVFITAHYSGATPKYMDRAIEIFCKNLKAYLKGKPMPNLVDKECGY